jgi:hypothetical protein
MPKNNAAPRASTQDGYQPARALKGTPPQGGSGVPNPASSTAAPATAPAAPAAPSGNGQGKLARVAGATRRNFEI